MTILVTNDDGDTTGVRLLFDIAKEIDKEAYALIPHRQRSAVSKSLTLHKALRFNKIENNFYELSGTPADCVLFSLYSKEIPKPDLLLSGINFGDNSSLDAVLSSGTAGACWESILFGVPAVAFSLLRTNKNWRDKNNWGDINLLKQNALKVLKLLKDNLKPDLFYSVNFPSDLKNAKIVFLNKLQKTRFHVKIEKRLDPANHPYYWLAGDFSKFEKGTDSYEVGVNNNIVISEISIRNFDVSTE